MIYLEPPADFSPKFHGVGCVIEYEGRILLLKRHGADTFGGQWGLPGGGVEEGENMHEAVLREVREETGYAADPLRLAHKETIYIKYTEYDFVYHLFRLSLPERFGVVLNPEEHEGHEWCSEEGLGSVELMPNLKECLELIYKKAG